MGQVSLDQINFVIIGAAKSATTWLRHQLQDDPKVYMPDPELHFFSREYHRGTNWYLHQFTPPPEAKVIGEKTNTYLDTPVAAERLYTALPQARLVAVLRDPVDRAYSDYCMYFRRGAVSADIEAHLDPSRAANQRFLAVSRYDLHLERLLAFYPAESLHIAQYESVARDPQGMLDGVRGHLGLPARPVTSKINERVNDSRSKLLPLWVRRSLAPCKPLVAPLRGTAPFEAIRGLLTSQVRYPPLNEDLRARMTEYLAPVAERVTALGYPMNSPRNEAEQSRG